MTIGLQRLRHAGANIFQPGHISRSDQRLPAGGLDLACKRFEPVPAAGDQDHAAAALRKQPRRGGANARGGAGDQHDGTGGGVSGCVQSVSP